MNTREQNEACSKAAAILGRLPGTAGYVAYCRNRISGLRKQALKELAGFLDVASRWGFEQKKTFTAALSGIAESTPSGHQGPCPTPLMRTLMLPTLREWADASVDGDPLRWIGMFTHNALLYEAALARNPGDWKARKLIVSSHLEDVWFSTHHLPDGYIGDPSESLNRLDEARYHLAILANDAVGAGTIVMLRSELDLMQAMVQDWIDGGGRCGERFLDLCKQRQRRYTWVKAYYYSNEGEGGTC